ALIPSPRIKFERIVIGGESGVHAAAAQGGVDLGGLFSERKAFKRVDVDGLVVPAAFVAPGLWGANASEAMRIDRITAGKAKVELPGLQLPPLDIDARLNSDGGVADVTLTNDEQKLQVKLEPDGQRMKLTVTAKSLALPFGTDFKRDEFSGKGSVNATELVLTEFEGRAYQGFLNGNARLRWTSGWQLDGELEAKQVDAAALVGPLLQGGQLEGKGAYGMRAASAEKLF